ncbi:MAG TPA: hypothetical protein VGE55_00310 [Limnobacter sp.]|uniref:hypothetical protein n=1 Tax=Limnobacter sp. TaxID=2003368 RepID=UPI002EDAB302
MIFIWSGFGFLTLLVPIVAFIALSTFQTAVSAVGVLLPFQALVVAWSLVCMTMTWFVGRYFNTKPPRRYQDESTGEITEVKAKHSLFFIKMEYWSVFWLVVTALLLFAQLSAQSPV